MIVGADEFGHTELLAMVEGFFLAWIVVPAKDGRHMAIGHLGDGRIAVVFATLGTEGVSVISMRPASLRERNLL